MTASLQPLEHLRKLAGWLLGYFLLAVFSNVVLVSAGQAQTVGPGCNESTTTAFASVVGEVVQLVSCTEEKQTGGQQSLTIDVPTGVQAGDFLVFVLSTDGENEDIVDPTEYSADWTPAGTYQPTPAITSEVFYRVADGTEPATYTFGWDSPEQYYSYMLRFTGASGLFSISTPLTGTDATAETPALTTNTINNLILKMVNIDHRFFADYDDDADVTGMTTPYYNVTEGSSRPPSEGGGGGATTSGAALYYYQAAQGLGAAGTFILSQAEEWHTRTMGIEPIEFRLSLGGASATTCSIQQVTISVTDRLGAPMDWFDGTVTITSSNATGAVWSNAGATNSITDLGDGAASYTFDPADNGTATFNFYNPNQGATNFDLEYNGIANVESAGFDPTLTITDCVPTVSPAACVPNTGTNNANLTIGAQAADPLQRGRMVVMAIGLEGTAASSGAIFNGAPMTLIYRESNPNGAANVTELWGILDANLPTAAGSYNGSFTNADTGPTMCMVYLEGVQQVFPGPSIGATAADPINGSQDEGVQDAVTSITTIADNSVVFSVIGNGSGGQDYPPATSTPALTWSNLFNAPDPAGGAEFDANFAIKSTAGPLTVTESYPGGTTLRHTHVVASFRPLQTEVEPTEIRLAHSTLSDVCSLEAITISVTDAGGSLATNFTGTITVTNSALAGTWTVSDATNVLVDNGNGSVTYTFDAADNGDIVLFYQLPVIDGAVDFDVTTTTPGIASPSGANDPILDVAGCTVEITTPSATNLGQVCRDGETVIYTVRDRDGATATDFNGLLVLQTEAMSPNIGDYAFVGTPSNLVGGFGAFNNGAGNDGVATYQFRPDLGDEGVLQVEYSLSTADTVTLRATASGFTVDNADATLTFEACEFEISILSGATSDVCSVSQIRVELVDGQGATVDDYTGTVSLSTSTGIGSWSTNTTTNPVNDPFAADGAASYTFADADDGVIILDFVHASSGAPTVNFDVTDNVSSDAGNPGSANDPNLAIELCSFEISFDGSTFDDAVKTACDVQQVTITVRDRLGNPDTDYSGTVNITTSTNVGNWALSSGSGLLTDTPGDDDGAATYSFSSEASVVLNFTNLNTGTLSVDLVDQVGGVDGVIVESGAADPELLTTSCTPVISEFSCDQGDSPLSNFVTIDPQESDPGLRGRMVVVATAMDGDGDVTSVSFDGVAMTQIIDERTGAGLYQNNVEMWGILDADIDPAGGALAATVIHNDPFDPSMCVYVLNDVEQVFPQTATPAESGQVNGTSADPAVAPFIASTTITTTQNNALLFSVVSNGSDAPVGTGDYDVVSPSPPLTRLFNGPDSTYFIWAGSSGFIPSAGTVTVDETPDNTVERFSHIVAAFNPLITGPPVATDFVPVTLFQTYSGNISYVAIAASQRTSNNGSGACNASPSNVALPATLNLPEVDETVLSGYVDPVPGDSVDSTVIAAYLYWFGSGEVGVSAGTQDEVTFIDPSLTETTVTAEELFLIENIGDANNLNYFAGWKDVTPLVTGGGTYQVRDIDADYGFPWNTTTGCAGGWALIVVYDNPFEQLRVVNLFHGFQPFQDSAFTLVPRNFRMATPDTDGEVPNGLVTHVTVEGDETIFNGDESLKIQDAPGSANPNTFIPLTSPFNNDGEEFNGTITRPVFELVDIDPGPGVNYKYQWDFDADNGVDTTGGYEIDFPGPDFPPLGAGDEPGASWGVDADTHYISGDQAAPDIDDNVLYNFAIAEAEEITTRYSSGQDLVLLVHEAISITNSPIADIEIFLTELDADYSVNSSGNYRISVVNNGNGATSFGTATGNITVTGVLPTGMTFAAAGDVDTGGTAWNCSVTLAPGAFTCSYDISLEIGSLGDAALPDLDFTVAIGGPQDVPVVFPSLSNDAKLIARVQHSDGTCTPEAPGIMPDPAGCEPPEFDNVNDLQGGIIDIDDLDDKTGNNNNVDSVTSDIRGIETDLSITKVVNGVLEVGSTGEYVITVTNNGPDDILPTLTTPTITVSDTEPSFVNFDTVTPDAGWSCGSVDPINCTFAGTLLSGASTTITVDVTVTGTEGQLVSNTASVAAGQYNFDQVTGNNADTDNTAIVAPPAATTERFLLSVSSSLGLTTLGGLSNFTDDDLILYDPVLDEASYFFDNDALGFAVDDINAVHLLPNGKVVFSAQGGTIDGITIDPNDLILYDPIQQTASVFFDGSTESDLSGQDIDAVYVLDNGDLVFSTADDVTTGITWSDADLVLYDGSSFSIYLNAEDTNVFGANPADVDAAYLRVDPSDSTAVIDTFVFSSDEEGSIISDDNTVFGRDDLVELTADARPDPTTTSANSLFTGNVPIGVFTAADAARRLNALHVIEDGYLGHFAITQSQAGSACNAGQITITKHRGVTHGIDSNYSGSVIVTSTDLADDLPDGTWSIASGDGTLINTGAGTAIYTYVPSDNGQVTLNLNVSELNPTAKTVNVDVSNFFVRELGTEDPNFNFNLVITDVDYRDEFSTISFNNNDGNASFEAEWQEVDAFNGTALSGAGAGVGNIRVTGAGALSITSNPNTQAGGFQPSLEREVDLSSFNANQSTFLRFDYAYSNLNGADSLVVEVTDDGGANYAAVQTITGISGTNASFTPVNINLSTFGGVIDDFTGSLAVRFRVANGYTLSSTIRIDNFEIATGTSDCNVGQLDHYEITVSSLSGVACVATAISIQGHDSGHLPVAPDPGTILNLSTSTGEGTWASIILGNGVLNDIGTTASNTDGQGTYVWDGVEDTIALAFNYTDPDDGVDNLVNINVTDGLRFELQQPNHDPTIDFDEVGLVFYNETTSSTVLPFQIAGKFSQTAPSAGEVTLQLVRSVDVPGENEASACESLIDNGTVTTVKLSAVCTDPGICQISTMSVLDSSAVVQSIPVISSPAANPTATAPNVSLLFEDQGTVVEGDANIGATLNFSYPDAGKITLHAEYNIPFNDDAAGVQSGDLVFGNSAEFIVRPFGFDVDFSDDRRSNGGVASIANSAADQAFARAGEPFSATVSAVVYDPLDDADQDGVPDFEADLSDNAITPNFGNESVYDPAAILSVITDNPNVVGSDDNPGVPGGVTGLISLGAGFESFSNGVRTQDIAINEVGIFDLQAVLVDSLGSQTPNNYFGETNSEGVQGGTANVGRIYPYDFEASGIAFTPRVNQNGVCAASSPFTYLGEEFGLSFTLQARNAAGDDTVNYIDDFAKLTTFAELDIRAIVDNVGAADTDLSSRLANVTLGTDYSGAWTDGELTVNGNMQFDRQMSGVEEPPFTALQIAFGPVDDNDDGLEGGIGAGNDVYLNTLDVDLDTGAVDETPTFRLIESEEFRYGRLLIDNAFGPETENLGIPLRIEYFDGSNFIVNTDDDCTALVFDESDPALGFVAGSFEPSGSGPFTSAQTALEGNPSSDVTLSLYNGQLGRQEDGDSDDSNDSDRPFFTTAPDPQGDSDNTGRALVEFDLAKENLEFLGYDWRGDAAEVGPYDEIPDGDYSDNPRGVIEFGSYRGHDRVINWQEIYIGN